ncbi:MULTISPECIES: hypothetical protein [unclassified Streptomyces]|uniref:hypothetical protein n=1 Tax=unclassified Streptomyces TaxID=2593676 RepID=UPI0014899EDA|nr:MULTISPECIES: hypothetical protein [unclassified Streptomyces]
MTASSQNPPGALPPESPQQPPSVQAAFATFGVALPVPVGDPAAPAPSNPGVPAHLVVDRPEPLFPQCADCGTRKGPLTPCPQGRRYLSGGQVLHCTDHAPAITPVQAATGVLTAAMKNGHEAPHELAQAEQDAGILFDPQRAKAIEDAAREQARAEYAAELAERGEQLAIMTDFKHRLDRVMRAIEGRPDNDTMLVREILAAAHDTAPYADVPMTLAWTRSVDVPEQGAEDQRAVVDCVTAHGGRAHLVLTRDERQALASLLDAEIVRDIHAPCPHSQACGTDHDLDPADLFGWTRVQIGGLDEPARWYCTPACVSRALTRAGEQLADADDRADLDGGL